MNEQFKEMWVDKYRPSDLESYVLNTDLKNYFKDMIANKSLQNMTFLGIQGSGKTTLAKILCKAFNAEVLMIKCATEGTLDVLRTRVQDFCDSMSLDGKIKIVLLDEIDSASSSGDNNFQKGLRTLIEAAQDDTRFILTANYNKILPAILSRAPIIPLKFDKRDLLIHVKKILDTEKIKYTKESLQAFVKEAFSFYPDCRRIISYLQLCSNSGELVVKLNAVVNTERQNTIKGIVDETIKANNILDARKFYLLNKEDLGDYIVAATDLFNYVIDNGIITHVDAMLKLTELVYQINVVVDKEPTFFGMLATIKKYANGI